MGTPLGELTDSLAGFKGEGKRQGRGREARGRETEERGRERNGRGGEVDSDAQLEQGRRWVKAGPVGGRCWTKVKMDRLQLSVTVQDRVI